MCLYPKLMINKKYTSTKKNGGNIPKRTDERVKWVAVGCQNCIECRRQKSREWQVRLAEEIKHDKTGIFVTLTFNEESLKKLSKLTENQGVNEIATTGVRRFLGRWRKSEKKSVKHWLITELGGENGRIHLHGLLFTSKDKEFIEKKWKYGHVFIGDYVGLKTVNYIVKYVTKVDEKNKDYKAKILTSPGIGKSFVESQQFKNAKYKENETKEYYRAENGVKIGLPVYYRNKIYSEEEREKLWIEKLDKQEVYVMGKKYKIDTIDGLEAYERALKTAQKLNRRIGYGSDSWKLKDYKLKLEILNSQNKK